MPDLAVWAAFVAAVLAMQTMPGPDMMLVIARGIGQGRRAAFSCVLGFAAAGIIQIPALAFGVAAVLQTSPLAYQVLRWAGAIYLIYVGLTFLLPSIGSSHNSMHVSGSAFEAFRQGFLNNLLNPKVLVFMLALLPQFVNTSEGSVALQFVVLAVTMKCCGFFVNGTIALLSGAIGNWLSKKQALVWWQQRLVGTFLIALGLRLAFDAEPQRPT